jgi:hypothetical protein
MIGLSLRYWQLRTEMSDEQERRLQFDEAVTANRGE